ncbi:MAG TPA: hypothetical protein VFE61_05390, partial [Candidatus Sulfotelmatobacter sp.]|nr:hypothetical protein [Candidatus Sulfotelmatobacter sp.]
EQKFNPFSTLLVSLEFLPMLHTSHTAPAPGTRPENTKGATGGRASLNFYLYPYFTNLPGVTGKVGDFIFGMLSRGCVDLPRFCLLTRNWVERGF